MRHRDDAPDPSPRTSTFFFSTHSCCHILILKSRDFQFEIWPADYEGDGSSFQKFAFKDVGEIDFIVGRAMTPSPTAPTTIEGEATLLETIPEIIAKKIYYRGSSLRPRDIFDIAAAGEQHTDSVIDALRSYRTEVRTALKVIERLNPDFVNRAISQLSIDDKFHPVALTALKRSKALLDAV
jgi:hypothetical protein